ncbi:NAD-dependent succinate-semialdehyde dehydrogenase [Paraburkholderia bonniea]|uniref:NAD-dependent succinate-semialdehyde dehydrogenase n=1 Tax=Paraburkholderia bonniea TaxID=2152891 RepID=UPI0012928753|nr:NAD-dependent succinate-semialdehyde dehydrogenase [Paraburkholderia bonniea]WJF90868.1 NAD-dependent succinate-semialdehyde dehydrogenase [Paraburkholderia bonniea]WJF94182.1 NAD-dependent succinate-semialdehyde dehydrogenase [Paraburkholderia bonniea]
MTTPQHYPDSLLFIDGQWRSGAAGRVLPVLNPFDESTLGSVAHAEPADLDDALTAAQRGFALWRRESAQQRAALLHRAAELWRSRTAEAARVMTLEQGKPLAQAQGEVLAAADIIDWFAEEARRTYGRIVPARAESVRQLVLKEPVGPVAAFTPWNFPVNQAVRKIAAALAAGCSIVLKGPEETPASCALLVQAFHDAGLPPGVLGLVFGTPAMISQHLIAHPVIRKVSFTGSIPVGKQLAALAGQHMKRVTMELGGHAPVIVCADADLERAAKLLCVAKFRNAGQICIAPTRFLIHASVYDAFVAAFVSETERLSVGNGLSAATDVGPLANARRLADIEALVADAREHGARLLSGGTRTASQGYGYAPTVLGDVPLTARIMNEEPFGPVALLNRYTLLNEALAEANRLPFGLAAYAYTRSASVIAALSRGIESGMLSVNHHGLSLPELPFGGIKESGYGTEGGAEALESYLTTKLVSEYSEPVTE